MKNENMEKAFAEDEAYETMQSANICSVHFFSKDPENKGISYIHNSRDHSTKAKGTLQMYDKDFVLQYEGDVDALKGRGNTTWDGSITDKRSYQVKLDKKADLLDPASGEQKAKKWILLANPFDPTLIRNSMIYAFGREIGLETTPEGIPVDFYYDGEYRGSYYLCEKVEIGKGRVDINDLESDIEDANANVDMEELQEIQELDSQGYERKYEDGIANPADISGGYLLEMDLIYYHNEKSWFFFGPTQIAVSKSPEYLSKEMTDYISGYMTRTYDYAYDESHKFTRGKNIFDYIDKETFVKYWFVNEWFANNDVWTSSTFVYKPQGDERLYAGPVWDCDSTMQIKDEVADTNQWFTQGFGSYLQRLPAFREALQEIYKSDIRPVIYDVLLGTEEGRYLKPATEMEQEIADSLAMNYMIWDINDCIGAYHPKDTVEANYEAMTSWMQNRAKWVDDQIMDKDFAKNKIIVRKTTKVKLKKNAKKRTCRVTFAKTKYILNNSVRTTPKYATKYQVAYKTSKAKKWKKATTAKRSYTIKKMKKGKTYKIKVRAVVKYNGKTYYGPWSKIRKARVK